MFYLFIRLIILNYIIILIEPDEAFLKLIDNAMPLINYKLKMAEEGINFKNEHTMQTN